MRVVEHNNGLMRVVEHNNDPHSVCVELVTEVLIPALLCTGALWVPGLSTSGRPARKALTDTVINCQPVRQASMFGAFHKAEILISSQ